MIDGTTFGEVERPNVWVSSLTIVSWKDHVAHAVGKAPRGLGPDDVIKSKHFPRYWTFARGIHRSPVNSPHKGQWRGALMLSLICAWINDWVNNREADDLKRHRAHYDVIVMNDYQSMEFAWIKMVWSIYTIQFHTLTLYTVIIFGKHISKWS